MRYSWMTILSLIAVPVAILLGSQAWRDYSQGWWVPMCVALLTVGLVHSVLRFGNRGDRRHGRH
jgi:hypothetical protein